MTVDEYFLLKPATKGYSFKKRWMTTMLISINGDEQRSAIFTWPRRSIEMNILPSNAGDLNYLKRILFKSLHLSWGFPFWQDRTTLTAQASSGQKNLAVVSTNYRNFEVGTLCLLFSSRSSYEVGKIASFTPTGIVLVDNLSTTWPVGTEVYPLMKAKIQAQQEIGLRTPSIGNIQIVAMEDYDGEITRHTPSISGFPTYSSIPVFNLRPRAEKLKQMLYHPYDYLSFFGKSQNESNWDETSLPLEGEYILLGRSNIWAFMDFFDYHKGRWGNFWLPTWEKDIVVNTPFGSGDSVLTIDPISYPEYWDGSESARFIHIRWKDGTCVYREIIDNDATTITLDSAVGKACADPSELIVSFLLMSRLDIDEIAINYVDINTGIADLRFQSLPMETPA